MSKKRSKAMQNLRRPHEIAITAEIVRDAMAGDETAIRAVLRHFQPAIKQKALRMGTGASGQRYLYVDPLVSGQMENQLIKAILTFGKHQ